MTEFSSNYKKLKEECEKLSYDEIYKICKQVEEIIPMFNEIEIEENSRRVYKMVKKFLEDGNLPALFKNKDKDDIFSKITPKQNEALQKLVEAEDISAYLISSEDFSDLTTFQKILLLENYPSYANYANLLALFLDINSHIFVGSCLSFIYGIEINDMNGISISKLRKIILASKFSREYLIYWVNFK